MLRGIDGVQTGRQNGDCGDTAVKGACVGRDIYSVCKPADDCRSVGQACQGFNDLSALCGSVGSRLSGPDNGNGTGGIQAAVPFVEQDCRSVRAFPEPLWVLLVPYVMMRIPPFLAQRTSSAAALRILESCTALL